ncbi:hypothetical protein Tco_0681363 [Tanacetum coccineum]|uniref:Uncharacterized protein n=1 Tax=Tanacetum coccineum TaxID=301880 RepID=A0ABQ4XN46_9ASTR
MPTESSTYAESPSMDAELNLTDSETESDEEASKINARNHEEGQAGPNPGAQDEGQAGPNPGVQDELLSSLNFNLKPKQMDEEFTTTSYPNVQENLKLPTEDQVILEELASSTGTLSSLQNLEKDLNFTDQFFVEKPQEEEPGKTNAEAEPWRKDWTNKGAGYITWRISIFPTRDLPTVDMKEILQQWMFKDNSYQAHDVHNDLYEALQKSLELDYSNQRLADQEEAHKKRRKRRDVPRTPPGSPPSHPPPPPPSAGAFGAPGNKAPSSSKTAASTSQSMAWTTSNTRYESVVVFGTHELSPTDYLMQDDSIPEEHVLLFDDEDFENDHQPKADLRKDWWKPLPKEERPVTPKPAWTIPSSNKLDVANTWASALATTYEPPAENLMLAKIRDMTTFLKWYCRQVNKTTLTQADFKRQAYEIVKAFYPDVIHLQFQMEECHKMLTAQVDWTNPEGDHVRIDVNRPLPLGRPPGHGSNPALSISKIKAASYLDFRLKLLVPKQMWIDDVCTYDISAKYGISHWWFNRQKFYIDRHDSPSHRKDVRTHMRILSVVRIKAYSRYGYDYLSEIVLRRDDFQEHTIAEKDFKNMYPSDFEDLNLLLLKEFIAAIKRRLKTRRIYQNLECFVGGSVRDIDYRVLLRTE